MYYQEGLASHERHYREHKTLYEVIKQQLRVWHAKPGWTQGFPSLTHWREHTGMSPANRRMEVILELRRMKGLRRTSHSFVSGGQKEAAQIINKTKRVSWL